MPSAAHTTKYPAPTSRLSLFTRASSPPPTARRYRASIGTRAGSIIAIIITTHVVRNDAVVPSQVCPGMRIHAIDIVQPPGIGIPAVADIDAHRATVSAALARKSSPQAQKKV